LTTAEGPLGFPRSQKLTANLHHVPSKESERLGSSHLPYMTSVSEVGLQVHYESW